MSALVRVDRASRSRRNRARPFAAMMAAAALLAAPVPSAAADIGPTIYDIVLVRPLSFAHTVMGAIVFLPVALQAMPGGTVEEAYNTFILAPMNDLANRPLGEF